MAIPDARRGKRFQVQLPCEVSSPSRVFGNLSGVTQNMSRSGVLAAFRNTEISRPMPRVGDVARIVVELPLDAALGRRCVEGLGYVVRMGQNPGQVAFEFRRSRFCPCDSVGNSEWMPFPGSSGGK